MTLVFIPVTAGELSSWAESGVLPGSRTGYSATFGLSEAFGITDPEQAEHVAMLAASVAALAASGRRLVAVAEANAEPGAEADFGEVVVADLAWTSVQSLFADEPDAPGLAEAATAVRGVGLAEAWDAAAVTRLLAEADLLWHSREEWITLGTG